MLFSSIPFLYYFLPLVLAVYFLTPRAGKNAVLFLSSLLFYAWGEPKFCIFMLLSILQGYVFGRLIEKHAQNKKRSKLFLTASVALSLALLAYCKYADFFLSSVNAVTGLSFKLLHVTLPIGISFYTFQILSYVVDVYRGSVPAQKSFLKLGTYIAMFPQLIAGPIVRYAEIAPQLDSRQTTLEDVSSGACRFVIGLSKKVLLANVLYELITAFQQSRDLSVLYFWLYAVSFALQLYFDFSGYSDMAIGLGRIFGFRFPGKLQLPVYLRLHHRILAALAHQPRLLVPGLRLYSARRKPRIEGKMAAEHSRCLDADRSVARGKLELCSLGAGLCGLAGGREAGVRQAAAENACLEARLYAAACDAELRSFQCGLRVGGGFAARRNVWRRRAAACQHGRRLLPQKLRRNLPVCDNRRDTTGIERHFPVRENPIRRASADRFAAACHACASCRVYSVSGRWVV